MGCTSSTAKQTIVKRRAKLTESSEDRARRERRERQEQRQQSAQSSRLNKIDINKLKDFIIQTYKIDGTNDNSSSSKSGSDKKEEFYVLYSKKSDILYVVPHLERVGKSSLMKRRQARRARFLSRKQLKSARKKPIQARSPAQTTTTAHTSGIQSRSSTTLNSFVGRERGVFVQN